MKQSTFSAVMANSIKNLLQRYTKGIRFTAILTILFTIGVGQMWGATETYEKVTSAPSDWSGEYLIVYESGKVAFNGSLITTLDVASNTTAVTISDNKISLDSKYSFTIAKSESNYTVKSKSGYYVGQTSNANGLKSSTSTSYLHTISFNNDGTVNLVSGGAYLRYNSANDQLRFRYYKSSSYTGQKAIQLYKKVAATPTLTVSETSLSISTKVGAPKTGTFTFSGSNLTSDATLTISGTHAGYFKVNPTSKTLSSGSIATTTATVTYSPEEYGTHTATLTVKSGTASKTVMLNGTATCSYNINYTTDNKADDEGGTWSKNNCFEQVGSTTEWRYEMTLPGGGGSFWVGNGVWVDNKSEVQSLSSITFVGLQGTSCGTKPYPGEGAVGYVRIYSDSGSKNYYAAFQPTYQIAFGIENQAWQDKPFALLSGNQYETELIELPADFSDTYKYYVGPKKSDNTTIWVYGKSSTDAVNTMGGMSSPADLKSAKGKFRMYDNSCDNNWYCSFIPYYNYKLLNDDGSVFYASEYVSSESSSKSTTIHTGTPTKTGYTFVGWSRTKNAITADVKAGDSYNYWKVNDTFYPVWKANIYTITSNLTNCSSSPEIPTSYTYTGSAANLTYTITPESGYRLPDAITVSGCAYTWDKTTGQLKLTGTISGNVTITIEAVKVYTITWKVNKQTYTTGSPTTSVDDGATYKNLTLPTAPANNTLNECYNTDKKFVGWSTTNIGSTESDKPTILFKTAAEAPNTAITDNTTLYAVFATENGGGTSTVSVFFEDFSTITSGNSTSTSGSGSTWTKNSNFNSVSAAYQAGGAVKLGTGSAIGYLVTKQLTAAVGETLTISFKVKGWSSVEGQIQVSGNNSEFTQPSAISYSSTMSGSFETKSVSVVLTKANPYIKIATTAKRAFIDDIQITKTTTSAPTYSNFVTECCTLNNINLDNSGTTTGGTFSATTSKACEGEEITLSDTAAVCYAFVSWTIKKTSDGSDVTNSVLDGDTLTMPDYAVTVYATFKSLSVTEITLSMTDGHKNLDVGETNQLLVDYTPIDATCDNAIVSWTSSDDNVMSVTDGLVKALRAGTATITATTEGGVTATYTITVNNPTCDSWYIHYWNNSTSGDECFYKVKPDDPNDHEWRTNNFSLPSFSDEDKFIVNNTPEDQYKTDEVFRTGIGFADIQRGGQSCGTNPYPGQDAYGQLSIYDDSNTPNRYIAFYPAQYLVTYGKEGAAPWEVLPLNNTTGYEYETEPFMVPNGYKTDETYKYYVGITDKNGNIKYVGYEFGGVEYKKSSVDAMNTVNGLSAEDMADKWGVWHIYSNSCANNWYCEFIHYYRVEFNLNGGEGDIAPRYGKAAEPYAKFSTSDITAPTRDGYTFLGWKDQNNKIYAPTDATVTINNDLTLTALWVEEYGSDNCRWEEVTIDDIEYGDEVVIAMAHGEDLYALPYDTKTASNSNPEATTITTDDFAGTVDETLIWYIMKGDGNTFTLSPKTAINKYLTCNASNNAVRIDTDPERYFTIENGFLKNTTYNTYLAISTTAEPPDWRHFISTNTTIANKYQTLKFYKKVCLPEGQYWVKWMVNGQEYTVGNPTVVTDGQITAIPENPANGAIGDCADTFMGWSESNLGSAEEQSAPTDLFTTLEEARELTITENKTFYAVFATKEAGGIAQGTVLWAENFEHFGSDTPSDAGTGTGTTIYGDASITYSQSSNNTKSYNETLAGGTSPELLLAKSSTTWTIAGIPTGGATKMTLSFLSNKTTFNVTSSTEGITIDGSQNSWTITADENVETYTLTIKNTGSSNARLDNVSVIVAEGGVSYSNYVTNCCALALATNLAVSGTTDNSATLTWTAPSSTTGITKLQVRNAEMDTVVVDNIDVNTTTATITGLIECTSYQYYVVSVGDCEVFSNIVTATPFSGAKTVNYDYNGGTGSPASFTTSCDDDKREIILPVATRPGYTFEGWYDSEENKVGVAGATYDPATSPITLYAHWTENIYQLTHSGSNYTNTENKTSIKSSETPFTLHYTCTDYYGLPATISITGGGKSWTVDTDYTWEVAADKQSATLEIKETVISANVTITINVATRYTVTFVHNDKGVFSGSETLEVLSSENTITLPTVTDVSCGFYDTFEGWIEANEDYTESTSKPATIYKGGANYTVNGDCTLRALYSKCEGDATQVYRKVTTTGDVTDGTYILVANTTTPLVYSGHTEGKDYGDCISGLTADGSDFSNSLPDGAVPVTVSVGVSGFSIHNGTKFIVAGTSTGVSDNASYWQLTDGSQVDSKTCPPGVLQPVNNTTYVLQKNNTYDRFKTYENSQSAYVFLYKLIDKCTKYYSTNPSCEKPVGVHIVYNANAVDASINCSTQQDRTYKVEDEVNKYPQLASQLQFCTNATREGYTLVGWNTQSNGQGTTYNINQNYYNLPVSGELDNGWITLNLYAMWKPCIKFNLGNATGGTGVPDAVVENGECVLPTPTAEQLGTIPCGYEFYAWSETSVLPTQTKPALFMPGDTYSGDALTLYAVYRWCEGNTGSDTYYFTFIVDDKTYCITQKHNNYDRFVVAEATTGLVFGLENGYLYYLDEGVKTFVYWEGSSTTVTTTTTYPNADTQKTTFAEGDNGTTIVTPAISGRYLQMPSSSTDRAYYTTGEINPTLVEVQSSTCTYATNPTCYTNTNLHFVTNGGTLNYPTDYDETDYQELAPGSTVFLPTATFAGEWTFEGWKRGSQLESQTIKPYDPSFYPVTPNSTLFEVDELGDIYFYAVYSKTNDDKQFDPVNGGTYKLFAIGADGTKTYMPVWTGTRGTPSGVTTCAETGDYTITPGTGTHAGQYQITCGEYTLGVVSGGTDLNANANTWWNIESSSSGKGTWRITVAGSTDDRALSCSFSVAKSFGNYAISNLNNPSQTIYRDMEIGECIYTEYTSTPENIPYITITGAPVKITSTNGERVYAPTTLHIEAHNFTGELIIHLSATNGFGVDPAQVRTNGQGAYSGDVKVYYEPTTDGDGQTITTSVLTASQIGGTNAEKINQTFAAIQGRNMPVNFVIAAKWDGLWYALPANCTSSLSSTEGLLVEVNDVENPTMATSAPASAKYGLREVIPSRQRDYGKGVVFTERFAKDDKQFALYNGSDANIQVNARYSNYAEINPDKYEWIPTTSDFKEYTLTNASTGRNLGLTSGTFGAYTAASNRVRLLPATFYEPAPVQVLKWKANSVIVMYTGAETTATTQVGDNDVSTQQTLAEQELTHGIYELTTNQALTTNAGGTLSLYFGANTRVELEIPLIISGEVTASANAHDVVILENSKLTAAATKYSYKDVYVYGGAKLAIPTGTQLGVNNIILRAGGVATNGAGKEATYQYIYPQVELKGTLTSSVQNIRYEYVTDYVHWYHLVLPFDGSLTSIHYPTEYYGDQVKLDNKGSWQIKRYAGEIRATGNYDAWKDIETEDATSTTAGQGYIFWGAPKKITANDVYDRPTWGIQRITMSVSAPAAKTAENGNKTIAGLGSYATVEGNSGAVNDQGWNLIGNPYMVNLTGLNSESLKPGKLVEVEDAAGNWTGQWKDNEDGFRYVTIPSDHFDTYTAQRMTAFTEANPMIAGRAFFIQLEDDDAGVTFSAANRASLLAARVAANEPTTDIETGIVLSNETMQDEVNFWIKDGKTNDYEYNADYPKTPNNTNFNIYGVHAHGDLSWVAISPELAAESMPIGYQVPAAGTYTLSVSETYYSDDLQALYVTDHGVIPEVTTDLLSGAYEFSVNQAETNDTRFTVSLQVKSSGNGGVTTDNENIDVDKNQPIKFIYQDKLYILRNGVIYDGTGKQVQTINK